MEAADADELLLQLATTPEQQAAVAAYYRKQAQEARALAEKHRRMKRMYESGPDKLNAARLSMVAHCERLIDNYTKIAAEYDAMGKMHEQNAGE